MAKAFISYKHEADPDVRIATRIAQEVASAGHEVFIDTQIQVGQEWPTVIADELESSDFLIVLVSEASVASEMIIKEVAVAHGLKKRTGRPVLLPVRVAYEHPLPYDLGAWLDRIQYALWRKEGDDEDVCRVIAAAVSGESTVQTPSKAAAPSALGADGNAVEKGGSYPIPLPAFDPRWLDMLEHPGGAVRLKSPFYVERDLDGVVKEAATRQGTTIRVKGSRQTGKTSVLARIAQHVRDLGQQAVFIDFQRLDGDILARLDSLLRYIANLIAFRLKTNETPEPYWTAALGSKDKLTAFIEEQVLEKAQSPLVLIMDEVDRLFSFEEYRDDFFGLVRSWHNQRAFDNRWDSLNIVLAYSTEASLLIQNQSQSPFNVGESVTTRDFTEAEVAALNAKHGSPLQTSGELAALEELLNGHPFLVRKALYQLAVHKTTLGVLTNSATNDDGPFSDHLHYYLWWLKDNPIARADFKSALHNHSCATDECFYALRSVGLITGHSRRNVWPRCGLYRQYFQERL
jgi:hypothetical protein